MLEHPARRGIRALGLALLACIPSLWLYLMQPGSFAAFDRIADINLHNALFLRLARGEVERTNGDLRVIAIDERSLQALGQFPWRRSIHAQLLRRLAAARAKTVALNIFFVDPARDAEQDRELAASLRLAPTTLEYLLENANRKPRIASTLAGRGAYEAFNGVDEPGGWLLGEWLTLGPAAELESLQASAVRLYTGTPFRRVGTLEYFGARTIPLDAGGHLLLLPIPVREDATVAFAQSMSYIDALRGDAATLRAFVEGKLVDVGPTAAGIDSTATTLTGRIPTFFANLRIIDQLLTGRFIDPAPAWLDVFLILGGAVLIALTMLIFRARTAVIVTLAIVTGYATLNVLIFLTRLILDDLIHVELAIILAALACAPLMRREEHGVAE